MDICVSLLPHASRLARFRDSIGEGKLRSLFQPVLQWQEEYQPEYDEYV
jgi:hypothetical protein